MLRLLKRILLFPTVLLIPLFLVFVFSPGLLSLSGPVAIQSSQPGQGGAFGATSYSNTTGSNATVQGGTIYGGSGPDGTCVGQSGTIIDILKEDFTWQYGAMPVSIVADKWKNDTTDLLCNDFDPWTSNTTIGAVDALKTLHWPADLFIQNLLDHNTTLKANAVTQPTVTTTKNAKCTWQGPSILGQQVSIDFCSAARTLTDSGASVIRTIYTSTASQISFLWTTSLCPFGYQGNECTTKDPSGLLSIWSTSWSIVLISVTAVLAYVALRFMIGSGVKWLEYATISELIPRIIFGLLAAYFSKDFFIMLIQGNNAVTAVFNQNSLNSTLNTPSYGIIANTLQIIMGLMGFALIIEAIARMAIIYLLFAFSPIFFFFATLRETQQWAKTAAKAAFLMVFLQAAQSATLDVGGKVLQAVLQGNQGN